jgi:hypothetical protein
MLEETSKLKKAELVELVGQLYKEIAQLEVALEDKTKELAQLKAKMSGKIGVAAGFGTKNPNVR